MENSSDKELRDKLRGMEFAYDPKAWRQMEAMLEKERKPKALFWWWLGSAACLFIAAGGFGYYYFAKAPSPQLNTLPVASAKSGSSKTAGDISNTKNGNHLNEVIVSSGIAEAHNKKVSSMPLAKNNVLNNTPQHATHKKNQLQNSAKGIVAYSNANFVTQNANPTVGTPAFKSELSAPSNMIAPSNSAVEPISGLVSMIADELLGDKEDAPTHVGVNDDQSLDVRKLKKKIFHYSLGASANVTGTTLGTQKGGALFYNKPSYMAGLTQQFMFFNRFAITNSILFSQTSFEVYQPKTSYAVAPANYVGKISEIAIPIGLKVYVFSKSKFRLYASAGIINHIQLKETFSYTIVPPPTVYNVSNLGYNSSNPFPTQTQFNHVGAATENLAGSSSNSNRSPTAAEFAINHAHRYYASFYSNLGAEIIAQKHMVFFAEPLFFMSLEKIGIQDKYKYNLGLNGGIRYKF